MKWSLSALSLWLSVAARAQNVSLPQNLDAETIESLGNNSLFLRWRPTSHVSAPAGWMNDPCGMMYDPTRDEYHVMYQWHPYHVNWGNISWGHAVSKDLVTWEDVGGWEGNNAENLATGPVGSYDGLGIFSGTAQPVNLQGEQDGTLTIFYTSVSQLPTNWRLPYLNGTETQSLATSTDGGRTWQKYEGNPIIHTPPEGWNVTGWRDPFFELWPEMDSILGNNEPHYYMVMGSGIKEVGPRIPFYSAPANDLTNWTYLGPLWEPAENESLGDVLETGSWAYNFEVSNFFSLEDEDGDIHYYTLVGTEGGNTTFRPRQQWGLWNEGMVTRRSDGSARFTPLAGGAIDHGLLYAVTSFNDTKNDRRVQWGWANEEMNDFAITQQGYQGAFALPREMYVKKTRGLVNPDGGLTSLGNTRVVEHTDGTFTGYTLGARPLPEVVSGLRNGTTQHNLRTEAAYDASAALAQGSAHMELVATLSNFSGPAGLTVAASPNGEEYTTIYFDPAERTINVNRTFSSQIAEFANYTVTGYFYPYKFAQTGEEKLEFHVYVDGSLLEVYVNDRFWLTTRIYPSREDSVGFGVYVGEGASVEVEDVVVWNGLANVYPARPANSSAELVFDTAEQTNNYTWWTGN
ncbi:Arabinanase/levansucrase/invertase [Corynespora cassiicola Philippines]|uniref:Arabinanase/levansucrase/invertase n=1 Tax=Corynespora cassiicola Philippines TaxID=1448308 RepID=A0A2T2NAX2_CORCC|nr:Arabinanase/levansucrase/invertase [Corynespora cassiicola Philippines]